MTQNAMTGTIVAEVCAALVGLSRRPGGRVRAVCSSMARFGSVLSLAVGVFVFVILALPAYASAASAPTISAFGIGEGILFSTRVELEVEGSTNEAKTDVHMYYSMSKGGPWTLACEYSRQASQLRSDLTNTCLIHHLLPDTLYYGLVVAENSFGKGEASAEFTTKPVSQPEIIVVEPAENSEHEQAVGVHFIEMKAHLESNGAETHYHFEYAPFQSGPWSPVPGCAGVITVAEDFAYPKCRIEGLTAETTYYVRAVAENEKGTVSPEVPVATRTAKPIVDNCVICERNSAVTNLTATSVTLHDFVSPQGSETHWRFEYATSKNGPWSKGPEGVIAASEADEKRHLIDADLTGLAASTVYYLRFIAENEFGSGVSEYPPGEAPRVTSLQTAGAPSPYAFSTHTFARGGDAVRVLGSVRPDVMPLDEVQLLKVGGAPTGGTFTLSFEGQTTSPIPYNADEREVCDALGALSSLTSPYGACSNVKVSGRHGGPYRVEFMNEKGGVDLPQLTADASGLTPSGTVTVSTLENGASAHTQYQLEYVSQQRFEECGWSCAQKTPELDAGTGRIALEEEPNFVPQRIVFAPTLTASGLPVLPAGSYHYRIVAANGAGSATSAEQVLTIPSTSTTPASGESCPNEAFRTGPSRHLPDCRAYEQVSPVDKRGASEIIKQGLQGAAPSLLVGADGDHVLLETGYTKWLPSPDSTRSNYVMSRTAEGWALGSATPQPGAGIDTYASEVFSPDLTDVGVGIEWTTGQRVSSPKVELAAGLVGGPYGTAVTGPRSSNSRWVGAAADFSRLFLASEDRKLLGVSTGTLSGPDLYEYVGGRLRQANVIGTSTIGRCGASMVYGFEAYDAGLGATHQSPHAVSSDGSRAFFQASPTSTCPSGGEPLWGGPNYHLYMRENGETTVDLGEYRFLAANPDGSKLILERASGSGGKETVLYETGSGKVTGLLTMSEPPTSSLEIASDLSAFYFMSNVPLTSESPAPAVSYQDLYRYDVGTRTLSYLAMVGGGAGGGDALQASPDGRDFYFNSRSVIGVPGGGPSREQGDEDEVYRYDSSEDAIQCISCASPFNPEPKRRSIFVGEPNISHGGGVPDPIVASANGDYVFFDTASALVSSDVNGEISAEEEGQNNTSYVYSRSSDVYEWRRDGVGGCTHIHGCLALITSGQGGYFVILLGTDASGRDVFFTSRAQLGPNDVDNALDIYDARIGGGEPSRALHPVECEGDACLSPLAAPIDTTPASAAFSGPGNPTTPQAPAGRAKAKRVKKTCGKARCAKKRRRSRAHKTSKPRRHARGHGRGARK